MTNLQRELQRIVLGTPWLVDVLRTVNDVVPHPAYVGAGAIRNLVWDALDDAHQVIPVDDVDLVYFEPDHPTPTAWSLRLRDALPQLRLDITNQANVHVWQSQQLGRPIARYASLDAAIASWPETATAVAVKLSPSGSLSIVAPYGLDDLFGLQLRPSPGLNDPNAYLARIRTKRWHLRWPRLTVHNAPTD